MNSSLQKKMNKDVIQNINPELMTSEFSEATKKTNQLWDELQNTDNNNENDVSNASTLINDFDLDYDTLKKNYETANNLSDYETQKLTSYDILNSEVAVYQMEDMKHKLNFIQDEKNRKKRMIEIYDYESEKYKHWSQIMKMVFFIIILLILLVSLNNYYLLPTVLFNILVSLVCIIGFITIFLKVVDVSWRDNMNYKKYDWNWIAPPIDVTDYKGNGDLSMNIGVDCIGELCCVGNYDHDAKLCVFNS